ncbi:MAG: formamidopyrimidine DNA glycosylase [Gammaproteobacteria bacterium]|nr:formamidopyrimidine DNA glycosylase [Gammaproteobacteria bacterium]HBW82465.1 formamidopyrimidine DNA glycosylase [Gammaproteobacteria bacterium]|tara:strand:+ start:2783 stop:3574 length:792 start_codon:yes stop_codon:yes gene_type:complete
MPEGDTLHRVAHQITEQLCGKRIETSRGKPELPKAQELVGCILQTADARGKHLLLDLDNGITVHSHLGMTGSWHIYPRGERWRKPAYRAALAMRFSSHDLICFSPKLIEIESSTRIRGRTLLTRLGPDLLADQFDEDAAIARLHMSGHIPLGEALMNQQLVAGIGNVYKSEIMFMNRLNPFKPLSNHDEETLRLCLRSARHYMRRNLEGLRRKFRGTTLGDRLWVYRRRGMPCLECSSPIAMRRQGETARSTYYCQICQGTDR